MQRLKTDRKKGSPTKCKTQPVSLILCCKVRREQIEYLTYKVDLSQINELWLDNNLLDGRELSLINKAFLPLLVELHLNKNFIGQHGVKCIVKIDMPHLTYLYINQNYLGNEGVKRLTKSQWPHLTSLNISFNDIMQEGVSKIQAANWKKLKYLDFGSNYIPVQSAFQLTCCWFPCIKKIFFPRPVAYVNHLPFLIPAKAELEALVKDALPLSLGLEYFIDFY